jgi:hypothetical protein
VKCRFHSQNAAQSERQFQTTVYISSPIFAASPFTSVGTPAQKTRTIQLNGGSYAMVFEPRGFEHLVLHLAKLALKDISNVGKNGDGGRDS